MTCFPQGWFDPLKRINLNLSTMNPWVEMPVPGNPGLRFPSGQKESIFVVTEVGINSKRGTGCGWPDSLSLSYKASSGHRGPWAR